MLDAATELAHERRLPTLGSAAAERLADALGADLGIWVERVGAGRPAVSLTRAERAALRDGRVVVRDGSSASRPAVLAVPARRPASRGAALIVRSGGSRTWTPLDVFAAETAVAWAEAQAGAGPTSVAEQPRDGGEDARFAIAKEAALGVVYEWEPAPGIVTRSDGLRELLGFEPTEAAASVAWWRGRVHPDDRRLLERQRRQALRADHTNTTEYRVRHRDGHWVHVMDRAVIVRDEAGGAIRVIGHVVDMTEQRRHARDRMLLSRLDELLRSASTVAACVEMLAEVARALDADDVRLGVLAEDEETIRWFCSDGSESEDRPVAEIAGSEGVAALAMGRTVVQDDRRGPGGDTPSRDAVIAVATARDGAWRKALRVSARRPRIWQADEIAFVESVAARVSPVVARIRAEAALRASEARFRMAAGTGAVTLFEQDADLRYVWVFPQLPEFPEQNLGRTDAELLPAPTGERLMRLKRRVLATGRSVRKEMPAALPDGTRWYDLVVAPRFGPDGAVIGVAGLALDITRGKQAEIALRRSEATLRQALIVKDEFLGLVSHELRTPLTVIVGMSRMLGSASLSAGRVRDVAKDIAESADVLNGLVESMLLLARLDQREASMLREPVLLHRAAATVVAARRGQDRDHRYTFEDRSHGALVDAPPAWMDRVVENLVTNAGKYSKRGGEISVVIRRRGERVAVIVADEGELLDRAELDRAFEPFYRAPGAVDRAPGAGLGLAVAKRIVELLGGTIWARPRPGGGAEFGFALPAIAVEDEGTAVTG